MSWLCCQPIRPDDAAVLKERNDILHFGDALKDFSDTAALISQLDLVISVDTSVAHLAGALAKPVWVLLTYVPDWRWLLDRDDSPWYPTARLFRQSETREWDGVIERVHEALPNSSKAGGSELWARALTMPGDVVSVTADNTFRLTYALPWLNQRHPVVPQRIAR